MITPTFSCLAKEDHKHMDLWLSIPPIETRLGKRIMRIMDGIHAELDDCQVLVHRTLRLLHPPKKFELELHILSEEDELITSTEIVLPEGKRSDWEGLCSGFSLISSELAERWPARARPDCIALMTDGKHLWFNPGRPNAENGEWLQSHLSGESPCAIILSKDEIKPFSKSWFDSY